MLRVFVWEKPALTLFLGIEQRILRMNLFGTFVGCQQKSTVKAFMHTVMFMYMASHICPPIYGHFLFDFVRLPNSMIKKIVKMNNNNTHCLKFNITNFYVK